MNAAEAARAAADAAGWTDAGEKLTRPVVHEVLDDVAYVTTVFVNAYFIGRPDRPWVMVDTGLPLSSSYLRQAAEQRFGKASRPQAIILTHGHFDHAGSARELAHAWDTTVYAHRHEMPYLTGESDYPPQDPTVGGAGGQLSRLYPHHGYDLGRRVRELPEDGTVPGLDADAWRWVHTPGHTPGHVSLWRQQDRTLIAGDALTTTDIESWSAQLTWRKHLEGPPAFFTPDWPAAQASIARLAELEPAVIAAGHGFPMAEQDVSLRLRELTRRFETRRDGRYGRRPAEFDEAGRPVDVPPPAYDPWPARIAVGLAIGASALAAWQARRTFKGNGDARHDDARRDEA
jgi:glyoxylase-like metal-dependent hydrolase (beta-lactamase superfamily II)